MHALGVIIIMASVGVLVLAGVREKRNRVQADKRLQKILDNPEKLDPRVLEDPKCGTLVAQADGFKITTPKGHVFELLWNEVEEIHAFKKDLLTTDLICLAFKKAGKDEYYDIHEEMAGYYDLSQAMEKYLPGYNISWFPDVAFPAFATSHKVIWKRPALAPA